MAGYGGARNRSGPPPDLNSARSAQRGLAANTFSLDADGFHGDPPPYPLAPYKVVVRVTDGDSSYERVDKKRSEEFNAREVDVWAYLWKLPQACAWSAPQYRYLTMTVGLYCRQLVLCESSTCTSADRTTLQRYADTLGMTPSGLRQLNWVIVDPAEAEQQRERPTAGMKSSKNRIRRT